MITNFRIKGIYQILIDTGILGVGNKNICFQILNKVTSTKTLPDIDVMFALSDNVVRLSEETYIGAKQIPLTEILFYYMDFYKSSECLPGLVSEYHYVKYCSINGNPIMICLCPDDKGNLFFVEQSDEDYSYKTTERIDYLDDLQEVVAQKYHKELPLRLNAINHAILYEPYIPTLASKIVESLKDLKYMSLTQVEQLLNESCLMYENDVNAVIRYGISHGMFRYKPNIYGYLISK